MSSQKIMDFSIGFGGGRKDVPRIPLGDALREYWKYLVPITTLPTAIICVVGFVQEIWSFWLMIPFFYGCGYYAMVPYRKKDAPYSFWMVACVLWVLGSIPGIMVFAMLKAIFR